MKNLFAILLCGALAGVSACSDDAAPSPASAGGRGQSGSGGTTGGNAGTTGGATGSSPGSSGGTGGGTAGGSAGSGGSTAGGNSGSSHDDGGAGRDGALGHGGAQPDGAAGGDGSAETGVQCSELAVSGDPRSPAGATLSYAAVDAGAEYRLSGVLLVPQGAGPFSAALVSHGKGGMPTGYSRRIAQAFVGWGMVVIAVGYTHAATDDGLPSGADGASPANLQRAYKARQLLGCLAYVDTARVVAHGHSMGAFVTGALLGTHPGAFLAASHTAGGTSQGGFATPHALARQIRTPYQLHHGDDDTVVALAQDQALDQILTEQSVDHELIVYPGFDHQEIPFDTTMLSRVRTWYTSHGVFEP